MAVCYGPVITSGSHLDMRPKINTNYIAIRPLDLDPFEFELDHQFEALRHVSVRGRVELVCDSLFYDRIPEHHPLERLSEARLNYVRMCSEYSLERPARIEVEVGDEVLFSYTAYMSCIDDGHYYMDREEVIYLMHYDKLSFNFTKQKALNDFLFIEVFDVSPWQGGEFSVYNDQDHLPGVGKVVHGPVKGAIVRFHPLQVAPEYKYHQTMNPGGLPLIRIPINEIIEFC